MGDILRANGARHATSADRPGNICLSTNWEGGAEEEEVQGLKGYREEAAITSSSCNKEVEDRKAEEERKETV